MGKLFTARAFIGVIGGLRNLSIEFLEVTTSNGIYSARKVRSRTFVTPEQNTTESPRILNDLECPQEERSVMNRYV
jgi:hypothetical protein